MVFLYCPWPARAGEIFTHNTAGFKAQIPSSWSVTAAPEGLELEKDKALLSIENISTKTVETRAGLSLFAQNMEAAEIRTPYPGLRASLQENGYTAEVVILKTPVGFYLLSLEQDKPDPANLNAFETVLNSFALLGTPPVSNLIDLLEPVNLGPIDLALPEGELSVEQGYLFWKSNAAGFITGQVDQLDKGETLQNVLEGWEREMLSGASGLGTRTSTQALRVEEREALQADYAGDRMQARVQVSALDRNNVLILALITRKETFASHQPLLDAVSFSVQPAGKRAPRTASPSVAAPPAGNHQSYNDIVMAVSERLGTDPQGINSLYKQKPALFVKIGKTLAEIRAVDTLLSSDPEQLAKSIGWQERPDVPQGLKDFHTALRSYRVSLGLLPQGPKVANLPGNLSRLYQTARRSGREAIAAYSDSLKELGDFPERNALYYTLLEARGQTGQTVSPEMKRYLQGKADLFWRNRLEAAYQHALLKENRQSIVEQLWQQQSRDLATIGSQADE